MTQSTTKQTNLPVRPSVDSDQPGHLFILIKESLLCAQWVDKDQAFFMRTEKIMITLGRLILVFAGRTCHFVGYFVRWLIYVWGFMTYDGAFFSI